MNFNLCRVAAFVLCLASPLFAQQRPLLTEDPRVIGDGVVVTELGFGYQQRARFPVSRLEGDQYSFLVNGLHIGFGDRAQFQIGGVAHNFVRLHPDGSGWRNDWGDFWLSMKMKIVDEGRARPIISFRPTVVLPNTNNEKGLGTDGTHFFGSLLFGKSMAGAFVFGNIGLGILDDAVRAAAQQDVLTYGIAISLPASDRVRLLSEWNGRKNPQVNPTPGGESRGEVRLGVRIEATGGRWDVAATAGTTNLDHRAGLVAGFTKQFQLWR